MQARLDQLYDRHGLRYLDAMWIVLPALFVLVVAPIANSAPAHYEGLSLEQFLLLAVIEIPAVALLAGLTYLPVRRKARVLRTWHTDGVGLEQARTVAFDLPRDAGRSLWAWGVIGTPFTVGILTEMSGYRTTEDIIELAVAWQFENLMLALVVYTLLEVGMRPVRARMDLREISNRHGVATRVLAPLVAVTFLTYIGIGANFTTREEQGPGALLVLTLLSLTTIAVWSAVMLPLLWANLLTPICDLTLANRAVGDGDLDQRLAVTTDDELGELALSFNEMVGALRDQEAALRSSRARVVAASDAERRRIERNIHDGAQQQLIVLSLHLQMLRSAADRTLVALMAEEASAMLNAALNELRELARGLHPSVLASDGLPPALEQLAQRSPVPVTVDVPATRFAPAVESTVYFVASEALANVAKYAEATSASITVRNGGGRLVVEVADDGVGGAHAAQGSGLTGLADRVAALDGEFSVTSPRHGGTTVHAEIPLGEVLEVWDA
jgi:signal transduction histidine kinase